MSEKNCGNCEHFGLMRNSSGELARICRQDGPKVFAQALINGGQLVWATTTAWPGTDESGKCGKWQSDGKSVLAS